MKRLLNWPLPNIYLAVLLALLALLAVLLALAAGCDGQKDGKYAPPMLKGTGTMYIFNAKNGWGTDVFHEALTQWLAENSSAKLVSIEGIDKDSDSHPTRYLVVVEYPPQQVPANPPPPDPNQSVEK